MLRFGHPRLGPLGAPSPRIRLWLVALGGLVFLSGCGFLRFEPREAWRAQAEIACMRSGIVRESQWIRPAKPIDGPGPCGTDLPLKVSAFQIDPALLASYANVPVGDLGLGEASALTILKPEATMGCPMVAWTDDWVLGAVQPAALAWFGQPVREIRTAGTYSCRRRNHNPNARLSEHAFGNAIDVTAFVFADGAVATVRGGWNGSPAEQGFLRDVLHAACSRFKTVLGPGAPMHHDHFHLDLAHHDAKGTRRYCQPRLSPPQRPVPNLFAQGTLQPGTLPPGAQALIVKPISPHAAPNRPGAETPGQAEKEPLEVEDDFDPSAFDITSALPDLPPLRKGPDQKEPNARQPLPPRGPPLLAPSRTFPSAGFSSNR